MSVFPRKSGKDFPVVTKGQHAAVLAAVQDLGTVLTDFGEKDKVRLVRIVDEDDPDTGEPLLVMQSITNSCHESATLYKIFGSLGISIDSDTDLEGFVGQQALLNICHGKGKQNRVYANVLLPVAQAPQGQFVRIPAGWEPPKVKRPASERSSGSSGSAPPPPPPAAPPSFSASDEDVPF